MTDPISRARAGAPAAAAPSGSGNSLSYEPFFGLSEKPFSLSADPRFLYKSPSHGSVFDALLTGIRRREGLIALTGEIGTGKTTLCRSVLRALDRRTFASFVPDPFVSREDLLKTLLVDFGVVSVNDLKHGRLKGASRPDLSYPLYEFLDSLVPLQAFAVLVIDEAQHLPLPLLEEIRILSEIERREKLLQVVLVGQPELREHLRLPAMRQVDQRVSVRCELKPLDPEHVAAYVRHRLAVAGGGASRAELTPAALDALYLGSAGVPRLINRIADRALDRAWRAGSLRLEPAFVWAAIDEVGVTAIQPPAGGDRLAPGGSTEAAAARRAAPWPPEPPAVTGTAHGAPPLVPALDGAARRVAPRPAPGPHRSVRRSYAAIALASSLAVAASAGSGLWYLDAQAIDRDAVIAMLPPRPHTAFLAAGTPLPAQERTGTPRAAANDSAQVATGTAVRADDYVIEVAMFESRARAQRLIDELTAAGYQAREVEVDLGTRGRLRQVVIGGYSSALQVERDLRRIRELPGYADARLVVR